MIKPTILITAAAGNTGAPAVAQLRARGYPVRALVRRADQRSERLRALGAEVVVGNMDDLADLRRALVGVQRAYYCAPFARDALTAAATFAIAAQEQRLEMVTVLSQWLADPSSPSKATRDTWLTDRLFASLPDVPTVTVNPGWFADNYRAAGLEIVAQLGLMMLPLGEGLNAPPSNEDIARVVVGTLIDPAPYLGKTYRPTGPRLLAPQEIADSFGRILGRRVRYLDIPVWMAAKAVRAAGLPDYLVAQLLTYIEEYRRNAFGVGAPTSVVQEIGGQAPEEFEAIARRYLAANPNTVRTVGAFGRTVGMMLRILVTPGFDRAAYERQQDLPRLRNPRFTDESPEWRATHLGASRVPHARDMAGATR